MFPFRIVTVSSSFDVTHKFFESLETTAQANGKYAVSFRISICMQKNGGACWTSVFSDCSTPTDQDMSPYNVLGYAVLTVSPCISKAPFSTAALPGHFSDLLPLIILFYIKITIVPNVLRTNLGQKGHILSLISRRLAYLQNRNYLNMASRKRYRSRSHCDHTALRSHGCKWKGLTCIDNSRSPANVDRSKSPNFK